MEDELTDPTDWPSEDWRVFDQLLRCPICKDFYEASLLLTGCQHNFCSLCVRMSLDAQQQVTKQCPCCRAPVADFAKSAVPNRALDNLVRSFKSLRKLTIDAVKMALTKPIPTEPKKPVPETVITEQSTPKLLPRNHESAENECPKSPILHMQNEYGLRSDDDDDFQLLSAKGKRLSQGPSTPRLTRSRTREHANKVDQCIEQRKIVKREPDALKLNIAPITDAAISMSNRSNMECPVCAQHFFTNEVEMGRHVESCLLQPASKRARSVIDVESEPSTWNHRPKTSQPVQQKQTVAKKKVKPAVTREPMKKIWYGGLKDRNLRELLMKCGLPSHGDRKTMERRHVQFINVWNAACDGNSSKTDRELIQQVVEWERTANQTHSHYGSKKPVMEASKHLKKYHSEFDDLIKQARERHEALKKQQAAAADANHPSDEVDDENSQPSNKQPTQPEHERVPDSLVEQESKLEPPAPTVIHQDRDELETELDSMNSWLDDFDSHELIHVLDSASHHLL